MSLDPDKCPQVELISLLAADALCLEEKAATEAHLVSCLQCQREWEALRAVTQSLVFWPTDVSRPTAPLWDRLSQRIASETGLPAVPALPREEIEPEWEDTAPGISCKLLATDAERGRVSMLVRLAPGAHYPPHTHADVEELHLLQGELWINDRKLDAGDFNRAEAGTSDHRVWTETGCTCVLTTSYRDLIR
jgi:hypothetical protein